MSNHSLTLTFEYDHALGAFHVIMPNGAEYLVRLNEVSGKLQNNLRLFAQAAAKRGDALERETKVETRKRLLSYPEYQRALNYKEARSLPPLNLKDLDI